MPINFPLQLQICRNGLIQFDLEWPFSYPYKFGARYWLDGFAMIAPYWALTDTYWSFKRRDFYRFQYYYSPSEGRYTYTWTFHRVDPNRWSSVYYQVYDTYSQEPKAENMLAKASEDIRKYHGQAGFADFEATWVLVVTWVKLYPLDWYYYDRKQDIYSDKVRRCVFFLTQSLKCFELLDVSEYLPCPLIFVHLYWIIPQLQLYVTYRLIRHFRKHATNVLHSSWECFVLCTVSHKIRLVSAKDVSD